MCSIFTQHMIPRTNRYIWNKTFIRCIASTIPRKSALAPSYSSTGDVGKIVSKLDPNRIATMIMSGKPNRPFPPEFQVDLEQFLPGAVSAAGIVTNCVSNSDWESLEGLVERSCIESLKESVKDMDEVQKGLVKLNPDDVFLSFVSNPDKCEDGNNLNLVTFSLPNLGQIKQMVTANKEFAKEIEEKIKASQGDVQEKMAMMEEYKSKVAENDPHSLFKANEIVIGNFRMVRNNAQSDWTITEVSQINSMQAWLNIFKLRWKGRLSIATRSGNDFYSVLRYDYIKDYIVLSLVFTFYTAQAFGAGVIAAPHS